MQEQGSQGIQPIQVGADLILKTRHIALFQVFFKKRGHARGKHIPRSIIRHQEVPMPGHEIKGLIWCKLEEDTKEPLKGFLPQALPMALHDLGLMAVHGKDYAVEDGDLIFFRTKK